MAINQKVIDELLSGYKTPEDLLRDDGIFKKLQKALLERALNAELRDDLGYEKEDVKGQKSSHSRNGHGSKRLRMMTAKWNFPFPAMTTPVSSHRSSKKVSGALMA